MLTNKQKISKIILDLLHTRIGTNIDEMQNLSPTTESLIIKPNKEI